MPPGYRRKRPPYRPKLEPYTGVIDRILEDDLSAPKKQRHTAKRIFDRLKKEHGFDGGYTIVKDYVRERRRVLREMFVPLGHPPGHAQCDFGQALVVIGGVERRARCFVIDLPHSYGCFVKAYPSETTESFLDGHVSAIDRKQPLGKPQHSDKDRSQHTETDQEADPNQQCLGETSSCGPRTRQPSDQRRPPR